MGKTHWKPELINKKFNKLTILELCKEKAKSNDYVVKCRCECGNIVHVILRRVVLYMQQGCSSCARRKINKGRLPWSFTHGQSKTKLYQTWSCMLGRCYNKKYGNYKYYGGRGIIVCDSWRDDFLEFKKDMYFKYIYARKKYRKTLNEKNTLTLERKDTNKNYCFENCEFIPANMQSKNRSIVKKIKAINLITGEETIWDSAYEFKRKQGWKSDKFIYHCLAGRKEEHKNWKVYKEWRFEYYEKNKT